MMRLPFRQRRLPQTREAVIAAIREHMALFGYPLNNYTDTEIEEAAARFGEAIQGFGISAADAVEIMQRIMGGTPHVAPEATQRGNHER